MNRPDDYQACAAEGLTVGQTAARLGVATSTVRSAARRFGIKFPYDAAASQPVVCRGTWYPSQAALARAMGVTHSAVWHHLAHGSIDRVGLRNA